MRKKTSSRRGTFDIEFCVRGSNLKEDKFHSFSLDLFFTLNCILLSSSLFYFHGSLLLEYSVGGEEDLVGSGREVNEDSFYSLDSQ